MSIDELLSRRALLAASLAVASGFVWVVSAQSPAPPAAPTTTPATSAPAPPAAATPAAPAPITPTPPAAQPQDIHIVLDQLKDAINTNNDPMRMRLWFRVREAMEKDREPTVDALLQGFEKYAEMPVKEYMVKCLSWTKSPRAKAKVLELMKSTDITLRRRATYEICNFDDTTVTPQVIDALKDPDERVRIHACIVLGVIDDKRAIQPLKDTYKSDVSETVRLFAKKQLELYEINYPEAKVE
ncbi:MAG: HEAT repeat domain-containing protein [Acidobacteriota bacterium]